MKRLKNRQKESENNKKWAVKSTGQVSQIGLSQIGLGRLYGLGSVGWLVYEHSHRQMDANMGASKARHTRR